MTTVESLIFWNLRLSPMSLDEKALFKPTLESLLQRNLQQKQAWLDKANAALDLSTSQHFTSMTQERNLLRNWLHRGDAT